MTNIDRLLNCIKEHPNLPIVFMVDGQICYGEDCYWLGRFQNCVVDEYTIYEGKVYFPDDMEELRQDALKWIKAIIVYIGVPEEDDTK